MKLFKTVFLLFFMNTSSASILKTYDVHWDVSKIADTSRDSVYKIKNSLEHTFKVNPNNHPKDSKHIISKKEIDNYFNLPWHVDIVAFLSGGYLFNSIAGIFNNNVEEIKTYIGCNKKSNNIVSCDVIEIKDQ